MISIACIYNSNSKGGRISSDSLEKVVLQNCVFAQENVKFVAQWF